MSLSWSEIKQKWIRDFEIEYPRKSIELAFNTVISQLAIAETGRKNDLAVKINSEWLNIEVKTPQKSDFAN